MITLTVNREGAFIAGPNTEHEAQCGRVGAKQYRYQCAIEVDGSTLREPEGFVIDNGLIQEYFETTYGADAHVEGAKCRSCENMAKDAIEYIRGYFEKGGSYQMVRVLSITVTIWGSDFSHITAVWKP